MIWSLSEIDGLARKAARGAGYPWGIAEEAGKAARWLCAAGLPGDVALARLLGQTDGCAYDRLCPLDATATSWQARDGPLCPLISGAALCDLADPTLDVALARVSCPLLLVPYLVMAADMSGAGLQIAWQGVKITRGAHATHMQATPEALCAAEAQMVRVCPAAESAGTRLRRCYRAEIDPKSAEVLAALAHRTYAPDTNESRRSGAGAGLSDND